MQHYHEIKLASEKIETFVCDFSFCQDLAYAKKGLKEKRLKIFKDILKEGIKELNHTDLLICLRCDAETLLDRIQSRGRKEEGLIDLKFLDVLNQNIYAEAKIVSRSSNVLYINSKQYNFVSNSTHQQEVINLVNSRLKGTNLTRK